MEAIKDYREWLSQDPDENYVAPAPDGGLHIPIDKAEELLDSFESWSTQNFVFYMFRDGYANNCVAASIEVLIEYPENGKIIKRTFVGGCNFSIKSLYPNQHFIATAKSLSIKNALTDIGKKLGRGLNQEVMPSEESKKEANDGIDMLSSINDVKPEHHVKQKQNIQSTNTK